MRNKLLLFYTLLLGLCFGGYAAYTQHALKNAQTFYLQMAPLDPLALLSGEYMQINYAFEQDVFGINPAVPRLSSTRSRKVNPVYISIRAKTVGQFKSAYNI